MFINRSAKVVKGGRRFNFSALVVVGDKQGRVGSRLGQGQRSGRRDPQGRRIGAEPDGRRVAERRHDSARSFLRLWRGESAAAPASPGTGIIAGKTVRAVLESAGVKDVLSKSLGSKNAANVVKATLKALLSLRLREDIYKGRGLEIKKAEAPAALPCKLRSGHGLNFYAITRSEIPSRRQAPTQAARPGRIQRPRQNQRTRRQGPDRPLRQFHPHRF